MKKVLLSALAALVLAGCTSALPAGATGRTSQIASAKAADDAKAARFFAHAEVEALAPGAFALQPESLAVLKELEKVAAPQRLALVRAIQADAALADQVRHFDRLSWAEQVPVLKRVFTLECQVMGFKAPELVIDDNPSNREAFFDFDPAKPGTGKVLLYSQALAKDPNKFSALQLLIHETRHSFQFQLGNGQKAGSRTLAAGFKAAFEAQHKLASKLSFCDFCSLLNEYEAFQTSNFVLGTLTDWKVDGSEMGCLSSQYDAKGQPVIDLVALAKKVGAANLLNAFNELERPQFEALMNP